ncbi:N-acetylmuramoyl-L-alanine amidase [Legionella bononiensis]|uniref:N-acetylmuramoyl-L-alanine amidase n=1 Tax=Legionella bononiensis TaxID=2793102 RepID=A0ABS1WA32_9GAMM|nr:N-acetylmuramoyl-L-alanine amidase [Legionella bononiensis]MBL7480676.1 N-acetylmuramoyl-L-alanine amidase [Legionella bononiensis]MBL7526125.1 N-acetylmuramoyl-L-alanine amidase [Legionella bononiensis]MBL7563380.1 N-acetylmuramoyl-L-alanine amidase [Legionella bononiensis]
MKMRAWVLGWLLCISSASVCAAQLSNITVSPQAGKTSLFITVNGPFTHRLFTLTNPNRVVLDMNTTRLEFNLKQLGLNRTLIKQIRSGLPNPQTLRLVFDVSQNVQVRSVPWENKGIRIDILASGTSPVANQTMPNKPIKPTVKPSLANNSAPVSNNPQVVSSNQPAIMHSQPIKVPHSPSNKYLRDVVVVLDAGHGGKDPGARGPGRSREKDVVLAITLKLKQLIDRQPGMRAVLTRSGDYYVGLRQRLDIARKYNGDVFVSIHADAFNNPHSNGASVFALSQRGATSEAARWLAEKENYSELGGVNLGELDDSNGVVRSVLIDLSQTATINSGLQMGGRVLNQLDNFTNLHNNKVEQAGFVVLKSTDIPSILVETGFISNPREERNLTSSAYQSRLSQAIFQGIKGYFWDNPPHGTRIEAMTSTHYHIVRSGDTLPGIASRYHVTIEALQAMNGISGKSALRPGQKLVIPSAWV